MPNYPCVTPEMMNEMNRQINGRLEPPDTARRRKMENRKTNVIEEHVRWNESAKVTSVEVATTVSAAGDEHDVYSVEFTITGTKGTGQFVGEKVYLKARINPVALDAGNKDDGQFKMSRGTLIRLAQLVKSVGFDIKGGLSSAQMAAYFPVAGNSPLVGKEVYIEIHQNESEMSNTGWNEEVSNVFPLKGANAAASVEV